MSPTGYFSYIFPTIILFYFYIIYIYPYSYIYKQQIITVKLIISKHISLNFLVTRHFYGYVNPFWLDMTLLGLYMTLFWLCKSLLVIHHSFLVVRDSFLVVRDSFLIHYVSQCACSTLL